MRVLAGLAAVAWLLLAPAAARAAVVSYTSQFFPANVGQTPQYFPTDWDGTKQSLLLPRFNPALGNLRTIDLMLYGSIQSSGSLNNTYDPNDPNNSGNPTADITSASASMDISVLAPGTSTPSDGITGVLVTVSPEMFNIDPTTLDAGRSIAFGPVTNNASSSPARITNFAPYVGSGNVLFPLATNTTSNFVYDGGNLEMSQDTRARAQAVITYTYDAAAPPVGVPEPATPAVLGAGLLCLGLLRRRG